MAKIGIRLADGKFYPILEEDAVAKKRLVVTTVKDGQESAQIDIYRGSEDVLEEHDYVGSLVIENIPPRPAGEPDIHMELGLDAEDNLHALAREESTGEHQTLTVSLKALSEEEKYEIPDFDFQEDVEETPVLAADEFPEMNPFDAGIPDAEEVGEPVAAKPEPAYSFDEAPAAEESPAQTRRKGVSPVLAGILSALVTAAIMVGAFLIYQCSADRQPPPPTVSAPAPVAVPAPPPAPAPAPAPVAVAPAPAPTPAPAPEPAASTTPLEAAQPATTEPPAKKPGVWYKIRWGDTLWDLSITYYRTPWLYGNIAKANKIKNPDLIISGTWIFIPPR